MKKRNFLLMAVLLAIAIVAVQCKDDEDFVQIPEMTLKKGKPVPATEVGNNLSYPVIWAEGFTKVLPGTPLMTPVTNGVWWYQWGTNGVDPNITPASCPPDPDADNIELNPDGLPLCDDGIPGQVNLDLVAGFPPADNSLPLAKAFLQKDAKNIWQAGTLDWPTEFVGVPLNVNWIDWGDNLESVDWYTRSQVRTEMVLFQDLAAAMLEYEMRHTSGWGIDEVHGLATGLEETPVPLLGTGFKATVYSHCARLTIQKLLVKRDDERLSNLQWVPGEGWIEPGEYPYDLINPHIFNGSVHQGGDGPGYYSAEINVKGRIIYGYTWNVRTLNDDTPVPPSNIPTPAGDYRITFSFDDNVVGVPLNTFFIEGTKIVVPLEEVVAAEVIEAEADDTGDEGGGTAVLDHAHNLTYIDVRILERGGGGGGGTGGRR
ncbi:MAG TPA: hypothetical protein VLQ91_21405 [Draconibacterium sp.]|nr:hypothetical protein [Draconibacterium sp.]